MLSANRIDRAVERAPTTVLLGVLLLFPAALFGIEGMTAAALLLSGVTGLLALDWRSNAWTALGAFCGLVVIGAIVAVLILELVAGRLRSPSIWDFADAAQATLILVRQAVILLAVIWQTARRACLG
ncbi:MAG: hypothetical protein L0241_27165 [Planctomycetia bacterium]|nr:hypothetical protein [Planctomycetia bacterium]